MTSPSINPDLIHLENIQILDASLMTSTEYRNHPVEVDQVYFAFGKEISHNLDLGRSRIRLHIVMTARNAEGQDIGLECAYVLEFHFRVENFSEFVSKEVDSDAVAIHAIYGATLIGMAYSTARGIIYERTRGTFFNGVILPVINPQQLLLEEQSLDETPEIGKQGDQPNIITKRAPKQ